MYMTEKRLIVKDQENGEIVYKSDFYDIGLIKESELIKEAKKAMSEYSEACDGDWQPCCYWFTRTRDYFEIWY